MIPKNDEMLKLLATMRIARSAIVSLASYGDKPSNEHYI